MSDNLKICADCRHYAGWWRRWWSRGPTDNLRCMLDPCVLVNHITGRRTVTYERCRERNRMGSCRFFEGKAGASWKSGGDA